jgi:hypothetical protein
MNCDRKEIAIVGKSGKMQNVKRFPKGRIKAPRARGQVDRFNQIREVREEREKDFLRTIEVRPF